MKEVRGLGLMIAAEFAEPKARDIATAALSKGLIANPIGDSVLRFVPPLIVTEELVDRAVSILVGLFVKRTLVSHKEGILHVAAIH